MGASTATVKQSMTAADATGKLWFSMFNDEATQLLGKTAKDMLALKEQDPKLFEKAFDDATYKTVHMRVKARSETYNETERVKYNVLSIKPVNWAESALKLATEIEAM